MCCHRHLEIPGKYLHSLLTSSSELLQSTFKESCAIAKLGCLLRITIEANWRIYPVKHIYPVFRL